MRNNLYLSASLLIISLLCSQCSNESIEPAGTSPAPVQPKAAMSLNLNANKWWCFVPRYVKSDSYTTAYGPDGINWPGLQTGFRFFPHEVSAAWHNGTIYMLYYEGNTFGIHQTSDGTNWVNKHTVNLPKTYGDGILNTPLLYSVNGTLYAYLPYSQPSVPDQPFITDMYIYRYNGSYFVFENSFQIDSETFDITMYTPCMAKLHDTYYLFWSRRNSTIYYTTSADGVTNWTAVKALGGGGAWRPEATTFKGHIYITSVDPPTKGLKYWKFDGVSPRATVYTSINGYKTQGTNFPIATDGDKLVMSFRDGSNTANRFVYSYDGLYWSLINAPGSSGSRARVLLYTGQ